MTNVWNTKQLVCNSHYWFVSSRRISFVWCSCASRWWSTCWVWWGLRQLSMRKRARYGRWTGHGLGTVEKEGYGRWEGRGLGTVLLMSKIVFFLSICRCSFRHSRTYSISSTRRRDSMRFLIFDLQIRFPNIHALILLYRHSIMNVLKHDMNIFS